MTENRRREREKPARRSVPGARRRARVKAWSTALNGEATTQTDEASGLVFRSYGEGGRLVFVLHGGPGAAGYTGPLCRRLAASGFEVLEPFQRRSDESRPLTVDQHVADLRLFTGDRRPALVGHSWGAMLVLAYAAAYPSTVRALVLIGPGTFDREARRRYEEAMAARMSPDVRRRLGAAAVRKGRQRQDARATLSAAAKLMLTVQSFDPIPGEGEPPQCDDRAHRETWEDMLRLQNAGVYPRAFARIRAPVLHLHGADDPHPGEMIRRSLAPHLPGLEYVELKRCGHYPWIERWSRERFFDELVKWLDGRA